MNLAIPFTFVVGKGMQPLHCKALLSVLESVMAQLDQPYDEGNKCYIPKALQVNRAEETFSAELSSQ